MVPFRAKPEESNKKRNKRVIILSFVMLILLLSVISARLILDNMTLQNDLDEINAYIESPINIDQYNETLALTSHNAELLAKLASIDQTWKCLESYPLINSNVLEAILVCTNRFYESTPQINTYDAASGKLNFDTYATTVTQTAEYIKSLEDSGFFSQVNYHGYVYSELYNAFQINVECVLSENAGKQAKNDN